MPKAKKNEQPEDWGPSVFIEFFGNTPFFRVLDFLMENFCFDFSKTEIARGSGVGWTTLYMLWPRLEKTGLVIKTRGFGKTSLYKLNKNNELARGLLQFTMLLANFYADIEIQKQKQPIVAKAR